MKSFKTIAIASLFLIFGSKTQAQNISIPSTEFGVHLPIDNLALARGDSATFQIYILKSKGFNKAKTEITINSTLPKGIQITFLPNKGIFDQTIGKVKISKEAELGKISLLVTGEMRFLSKGTILTIEVQ